MNSRNHMKMQKSIIFFRNLLYLKDIKYCKFRDRFHYTVEYRGAAHSIYNLKYSVVTSHFVITAALCFTEHTL